MMQALKQQMKPEQEEAVSDAAEKTEAQ